MAGWGAVVVQRVPVVPGHGENRPPKAEGFGNAPGAPQVPVSPSHGEAAGVVYRGVAAGGNLAATASHGGSPASGGEVPAAPPVPSAALGNRFLFFFQLCLHQPLRWFAVGNPSPVATGPPCCHVRGLTLVLMHGEYPRAFWPRAEIGVARVSSCPQDLRPVGHQ